MEYCVYVHIAPNGKKYVGITKNPRQRWCYGNGYKKHAYFWSAISKYGWENFRHVILLDCLTEAQAKQYERCFIELFRSNERNFGYNLTSGGDGICGYKHTQEAKERIGRASHERIRSAETRRRIAESKLGKPHHCTLTNEQRKAKSDRAKLQWQNPEYREYMISCISGENNCNYGKPPLNALKVRCKSTGEVFDSIALAAKKYNLQPCHISACCKGKRKTCGGFTWEYV